MSEWVHLPRAEVWINTETYIIIHDEDMPWELKPEENDRG